MAFTWSDVPFSMVMEEGGTPFTFVPLIVNYNIQELDDRLEKLVVAEFKSFFGSKTLGKLQRLEKRSL